jgi:creatinine amidohydrolase
MSHIIQYDELTWPEVATLPRGIPMVLPLGQGFLEKDLASRLKSPQQIVMLPSIPFGWGSSELPVEPSLFATLLDNLARCLREDGFTHLFLLSPLQEKLAAFGNPLLLDYQPAKTTLLPLFKNVEMQQKVVLIPIGHTEQHGFHLPLSTDTVCIDAIASGTESTSKDHAFRLPVFPYGVSTHRREFPGTLDCGGRVFEDFWLKILDVLVQQGSRMIFMISGHGGNVSFLSNVVKYAGDRHPDCFCATTWLYLSGPKGVRSLNRHRQSGIGGMGHACELETSLLLHLRPDLVHMDRVVDETEFISTPSYFQDWVEGGALIANPPWSDDTETGAYGAGSLGTVEKGKIWLHDAIEEKVDQVNEIIEQHQRRTAKRLR